MAIKIGTNITLSNDPEGDEGRFRSVNYGVANIPSSSATEGDIGWGDNTNLYVYNGNAWVDFEGNTSFKIGGAGSVLTPGDGYEYHVFSSPSSVAVTGGNFNVDLLLIGGGGGGGCGRVGGGGGAGGVLYVPNHPVTPGQYPVVIGAGGVGGTYWSLNTSGPAPNAARGTNGGSTSVFGQTAYGGGKGGGYGGTVGSGGGGHAYSPITGDAGTPGQGFPGGKAVSPNAALNEDYFTSAGGGGAGQQGGSVPNYGYRYGGRGGYGRTYESYGFNMPSFWGEIEPGTAGGLGGTYIAGGGGATGGGGSGPAIGADPGVGGFGGGGRSGPPGGSFLPAQNAKTYGGGGGGGGFVGVNNWAGGNGYQGLAIIRRSLSQGKKNKGEGGDHVYEIAGIRYHVFLSPGSFVLNEGPVSLNAMIVAGGGGGGSGDMGGGGGGGGARVISTPKSAATYPVVVGTGGAGGREAWGDGYPSNPPLGPVNSYAGEAGYRGQPSSALGFESRGGGGGGCYLSSLPRIPGGSGGGGAWYGPSPTLSVAGGIGNTPPTTPPQGNPGGDGTLYKGGGGGGAGAAGSDSTPYPGGPAPISGEAADGGSGLDMTGTFPSQIYWRTLAGGGGGGKAQTSPYSAFNGVMGFATYGGGYGGVGRYATIYTPVRDIQQKNISYQEMGLPATVVIPGMDGSTVPSSVSQSANRWTLAHGMPGIENLGGGGGGAGGYSGPPNYLHRGRGGDGSPGCVIIWYDI